MDEARRTASWDLSVRLSRVMVHDLDEDSADAAYGAAITYGNTTTIQASHYSATTMKLTWRNACSAAHRMRIVDEVRISSSTRRTHSAVIQAVGRVQRQGCKDRKIIPNDQDIDHARRKAPHRDAHERGICHKFENAALPPTFRSGENRYHATTSLPGAACFFFFFFIRNLLSTT